MTEKKQGKNGTVEFEEVAARVADCIGYSFTTPALMIEALTHKSYFNENDTDWNSGTDGVAAAVAAGQGIEPREVDVARIQRVIFEDPE